MNQVLSSIGIGAATVDTVFPRTELVPGETVTADVELYGGDATQEIDGIYFDENEASITFDRADADMIRRRLKNEIERHTTSNHR